MSLRQHSKILSKKEVFKNKPHQINTVLASNIISNTVAWLLWLGVYQSPTPRHRTGFPDVCLRPRGRRACLVHILIFLEDKTVHDVYEPNLNSHFNTKALNFEEEGSVCNICAQLTLERTQTTPVSFMLIFYSRVCMSVS